MLKKLVPIVATLLLVGCSSNPARDQALIDVGVQYATAKYIEHRPESKENIVRIATAAKALASSEPVTLVTLQGVVGSELDKLSLSPADRVLADSLVSLVVAELQAKVADGVLPADQLVRVNHILDLIIATASA